MEAYRWGSPLDTAWMVLVYGPHLKNILGFEPSTLKPLLYIYSRTKI